MRNKHLSEEHKKHISEAMKGKHPSEEHRKHLSEALKGNTNGKGCKGKIISDITKKKISKANKGKPSPNWGKHPSKETRKKLSLSHRGKIGEKSSNWQGGKSFEPYPPIFTRRLKEAIRERDNYICQICGEYPAFEVHHIDYDKLNCEPKNLITLCKSCHSKTGGNRKYWINHFFIEDKK